MSQTKWYTWFTCVYLLLNLPISRLLGVPFTHWLTAAFICLVSLGIFARLERQRGIRSDELQQLTRMLTWQQRTWTVLEKQWIGRTVRLNQDIWNSNEPEGRQVYVQAGSVGKVVALNRDARAPFIVQFPEFGPRVRVRVENLDVPLKERRAGNVPATRRSYGPFSHRLLERRTFDDDDDEDDVPEDAEAFVDEMRHFAALDWHVWRDPYARRAYQQMRHGDN